MFIVISIMLMGILTGYLSRNQRFTWIHQIITFLIWILLFLLGTDVGKNKTIFEELPTLGLEAFIITIGAVLGSALLAWVLWCYILKKERKREDHL